MLIFDKITEREVKGGSKMKSGKQGIQKTTHIIDLNNFHFLLPGGFLRLLFQKYTFLSSKAPERLKQFKDIDEIIQKYNLNSDDYKKILCGMYNPEQIKTAHLKIHPIYIEMRKKGWSDRELKK